MNYTAENRTRSKMFGAIAWVCVLSLFYGDVLIPVGESSLYTPVALFPAVMLFLIRIVFLDLSTLRGAIALLGVLAAGMLSVAWSDYVSFNRSVAAMFPVATAILFLLALHGVLDLDRIIRSAVFFGGSIFSVWIIFLVFQAVQASISGLPFYEAKLLIETPLGRSNYLAAFVLTLLAFSWRSSFCLSLLGLISLGALAIYSRGALLVGLFFLTICFFNTLRVDSKRIVFLLIAILLLCLLVAIFFNGFLIHNNSYNYFESVENRFLLWGASIDMISNAPFFGVGPNGFRTIVEGGYLEDVWGPHNSILLLWLNYGVVGLCFYLTYLFFVFNSLYRIIDVERNNFYIFVLLCLLVFFSMFEPLVGSATFEILLAIIYLWATSFRKEYLARLSRFQY